MKTRKTLVASALLLASSAVWAHGPAGHGAHHMQRPLVLEQKEWGIGAPANAVTRTVTIRMSDDMRFSPSRIEVREGEVIRFRVVNAGALLHEMVIGTRAELDAHAEMMIKFPNMEHDEPYMAHVDPGKTGEIIWRFNRVGEFEFACLIAGHFQAGMRGTLVVNPKGG